MECPIANGSHVNGTRISITPNESHRLLADELSVHADFGMKICGFTLKLIADSIPFINPYCHGKPSDSIQTRIVHANHEFHHFYARYHLRIKLFSFRKPIYEN